MDNDALTAILVADVIAAQARRRENDTSYARRDLVRTLFAAIEGIVSLYHDHVLRTLDDIGALDQDEKLAAASYLVTVNESGKLSKQPRFLSTRAMIRFTTRLAKRADPAFEADFGDGGWSNLKLAFKIRNRITHPKLTSDMEVSPSDLETCLIGFYWLLEIATGGMQASNDAFQRHTQEFRDVLESLKRGDPETWALYRLLQNESED